MTENDELYGVFVQEAVEQLAALEAGLLLMEDGADDAETINAVFRAAHTIKGSSGVVELTHVERFTHVLENVLDRVRTGELLPTVDLISDLLRACDHLGSLLGHVGDGMMNPDPELQKLGAIVADALKKYSPDISPGSTSPSEPPNAELPPSAAADSSECWHLSIRFGHAVLRNGMDPLAFLRYLLSLGELIHITTIADSMPAADEMDPESCYLGFEIEFRSNATKDNIERVFDFVRDDCQLEILPPSSKINDYIRLIESLPEENLRMGEILVRSGAITQDELEQGLSLQRKEAEAGPQAGAAGEPAKATSPLGAILVRQHAIQPEVVEAAASKQKTVAEKKQTEARLIRVHADKLDHLIDLVGELVIAGASANLVARNSQHPALIETTSVLSRLVENIRDSALQLRMVQIGETFNRFQRVVRDVSKELGKDIELVISGGDTELDKTVVEKIGDPLMHLIRNAIDHGIETAEKRAISGKSARGRLELNASHESGSILIEVADDGGGLNKDRILQKAIDKGIVPSEQNLSDQEIHNLIFEPGFSTAETVSNLSGRGVGMDVVKKNIQLLRGSVDVQTQPGQGSRFRIKLPLTLAIIDGFLVGVGKSSYVVPLELVVECMELKDVSSGQGYLNLRGEVLPFIRLRDLFGIPGPAPARENVVVINSGTGKAGLVVDMLHGEFQTVIKPLSDVFKELKGLAGSTIVGSGEVALILDVDAITQIASNGKHTQVNSVLNAQI